jgi:methylated-DNA-[protein]-cysteine S-methyltransferase
MDAEWVLGEALDTRGWSEFQTEVYRAVLSIPHGETRTYAWVANRIRRPGASRAVGQALRRNQHLILVPCHRVTSAGDIGGFMGLADPDAPELRFKQGLLDWEHSWRNPAFSFFGHGQKTG